MGIKWVLSARSSSPAKPYSNSPNIELWFKHNEKLVIQWCQVWGIWVKAILRHFKHIQFYSSHWFTTSETLDERNVEGWKYPGEWEKAVNGGTTNTTQNFVPLAPLLIVINEMVCLSQASIQKAHPACQPCDSQCLRGTGFLLHEAHV